MPDTNNHPQRGICSVQVAIILGQQHYRTEMWPTFLHNYSVGSVGYVQSTNHVSLKIQCRPRCYAKSPTVCAGNTSLISCTGLIGRWGMYLYGLYWSTQNSLYTLSQQVWIHSYCSSTVTINVESILLTHGSTYFTNTAVDIFQNLMNTHQDRRTHSYYTCWSVLLKCRSSSWYAYVHVLW